MTRGFGHFDSGHLENFCAAVLLLAMDVDPNVRALVARTALDALGIEQAVPLRGIGREARLEETAEDHYARVDIWLLFEGTSEPFYVFLEVKSHTDWSPAHVAEQIRDQGSRQLVRNRHTVRGSVLLAPSRLCEGVRRLAPSAPCVSWEALLTEMRRLPASALTTFAIEHIEEQMDHPAGLDTPLTILDFERATTTIACLRQFLADCAADLKATVTGQTLYTTPGDGRPRRAGGWAWHGLAVPFTFNGQKGRLGIYKYADAPPGEADALDSLWLEAYLGASDEPVVATRFSPPTLSSSNLDGVRLALVKLWNERIQRGSSTTDDSSAGA